jgi:hypothetical protein
LHSKRPQLFASSTTCSSQFIRRFVLRILDPQFYLGSRIYRSKMLCEFCEKIFRGHSSMGHVTEVYSAQYRPHSNGENVRLSAADGCQLCCLLWNQINAYSLSGQYHWATELSKASTAYFLASESVSAAKSSLYLLVFRVSWGGLANTTLPIGIMPCMFSIM